MFKFDGDGVSGFRFGRHNHIFGIFPRWADLILYISIFGIMLATRL